jgi:DNA repair exonuclease SbcCD ATPase subunit
MQDDFTRVLVDELSDLKSFIMELEDRMEKTQKFFIDSQEGIRKNFVEDIKTLDTVLKNQSHFMQEIEKMKEWNKEVEKSFKYFSEVQLPELDNVVHKHIDILRIAEQDHYNKLKAIVEKSIENQYDFTSDLEKIQHNLDSMKHETEGISQAIVGKTVSKLSQASKEFESELILLRTHTEGLRTILTEEENRVLNIKNSSEMILKQMVLSSTKMDELEEKNSHIAQTFETLHLLLLEIEKLKNEYDKAQHKLFELSKEMQETKSQEFVKMQMQLQELTKTLSQKIDNSLEKLHDHYHIASEDISQSVQILAKKAQSLKEYSDKS